MTSTDRPRVAVVVPCHNEESTVAAVVEGFRSALPDAVIWVADNNSSDNTADVARAAGARVVTEPRPGKGWAVRRLLADVDADVYLMVDGDATYDPSAAPEMVRLVLAEGIDMVNGARVAPHDEVEAYRRGHRLGNAMLTWIFTTLFGLPIEDTLSGYRAFSRRFVRSFPTAAEGFEIETEINVHAAVVGVPTAEVATTYVSRPEGSESKLNTMSDGVRILRRNLHLFRDARPLLAFSVIALPFALLGVVLMWIAISEYVSTGVVNRFPSLIAGVGCALLAVNLVISGIVMARITRNRNEALRLAYLSVPRYATAQTDLPL